DHRTPLSEISTLFRNEGISYMWMFQYMPIGRNPDDGLEISNEQRLNLFREWEKMLKDEKRNYPFFDFWNSGMSSSGCIAGAREGGYFYINWDGNIMPCVFVPFYKDNVKELYKEGSSLKDAVQSPFFKDIRKWQSDYFHGKCVGCGGGTGNMLTPCLIRDNHDKFLEVVKKYYNEGEVKPENEEARKALESDKWNKHLTQKGNEYKELSSDIWREEYEQK
ncbi:MAG: SPASM domain-containing protein, partial [Minisyncoccales bacterium]